LVCRSASRNAKIVGSTDEDRSTVVAAIDGVVDHTLSDRSELASHARTLAAERACAKEK